MELEKQLAKKHVVEEKFYSTADAELGEVIQAFKSKNYETNTFLARKNEGLLFFRSREPIDSRADSRWRWCMLE